MAFNSGKTNLKFSKKRNQWENSNQSCRIVVNENENDFVKAYSYGEVIFCYSEEIKKWIFNDTKLSVTTSSHQSALFRELCKNSNGNYIVGHFKTLNHSFEYDQLTLSNYNLDLVEQYFPEKLNDFKKAIADKDQSTKNYNSKQAALKNLRSLKYKTKKAALKAFQVLVDYHSRPYTIDSDLCKAVLKYELTHDEIKKYFRPCSCGPILAYEIYKNGHLKLLCKEIATKYLSNRDIQENNIKFDIFYMLKELLTAEGFAEFLEYNEVSNENPQNSLDDLYCQYLANESLKNICEAENE